MWGARLGQGQAGTRVRLGPQPGWDQSQPQTLPIPWAVPQWAGHQHLIDWLHSPAPWAQLMQKQLQAFMKSHFCSFPAPLKAPLISRSMMATAVHPPQDWPTPRPGPVGENGMGESWGLVPDWRHCLPGSQPIWASVFHPRHDAWGCTRSLKESLALYRACIETKMDPGRWGHSITASACVPHYTCLPPPTSDATIIFPY